MVVGADFEVKQRLLFCVYTTNLSCDVTTALLAIPGSHWSLDLVLPLEQG